RLNARVPEIDYREDAGSAVDRGEIVDRRGAEHIHALAKPYREIVGALERVEQLVVGREAKRAHVVAVDRAEHIARERVRGGERCRQHERGDLRLPRHEASMDLGAVGRGAVVESAADIAGPHVAVIGRTANANTIIADRRLVGDAAEQELAWVRRSE